MSGNYSFVRHNRSWKTIAAVLLVYTLIAGAILLLEARIWIVAPFALTTLPALWDLYHDTRAGLILDDIQLQWQTGERSAHIRLDEIEKMRFDTRWDFSVRVSACLKTGKKVRLPHECLPPHRALESEFQSRGLTVERHHFVIF
ncbi:MAG: hypothetical protein AAF408_18650 [Pseudomonadota bacterium]